MTGGLTSGVHTTIALHYVPHHHTIDHTRRKAISLHNCASNRRIKGSRRHLALRTVEATHRCTNGMAKHDL